MLLKQQKVNRTAIFFNPPVTHSWSHITAPAIRVILPIPLYFHVYQRYFQLEYARLLSPCLLRNLWKRFHHSKKLHCIYLMRKKSVFKVESDLFTLLGIYSDFEFCHVFIISCLIIRLMIRWSFQFRKGFGCFLSTRWTIPNEESTTIFNSEWDIVIECLCHIMIHFVVMNKIVFRYSIILIVLFYDSWITHLIWPIHESFIKMISTKSTKQIYLHFPMFFLNIVYTLNID
jgi:hypothetical protein